MSTRSFALVWIAATLGAAGYLTFNLIGEGRSVFLPGETTGGHHQIEAACESCHTPFGGVRQDACLDCHQEELETAQDSHDEGKFNDPRFAGDLARLDVRQCITCHTEHRAEITVVMGVTLPEDLCYRCHVTVGEDRPSHQDLAFETCASAGCHNYHDNRALYEDFLAEHGNAESATIAATVPVRNAWISWDDTERMPLGAGDADGPDDTASELVGAWAGSAHAAGGVACADCHTDDNSEWYDDPPRQMCGACHELEHQGFTTGKHGMRWAAGLESMSPAMARLSMQPDALATTLDCGSCHDVHAVDVRRAAVDACLTCHADEHSVAYTESPHFQLWQSEIVGVGPPESGVSCATCHLPRESRRIAGEDRIVVEHNQNANLRPNEKMIRDVCLTCHSLALSIDALADPVLIRNNFAGPPAQHIPSIDMVRSRMNTE